ncbi:MAG: hypothetical protein KKB77_00360, partial [Bacteroidetes bacterium]|nr:hypothetical protein [Bacteroidota bacterium]
LHYLLTKRAVPKGQPFFIFHSKKSIQETENIRYNPSCNFVMLRVIIHPSTDGFDTCPTARPNDMVERVRRVRYSIFN